MFLIMNFGIIVVIEVFGMVICDIYSSVVVISIKLMEISMCLVGSMFVN